MRIGITWAQPDNNNKVTVVAIVFIYSLTNV